MPGACFGCSRVANFSNWSQMDYRCARPRRGIFLAGETFFSSIDGLSDGQGCPRNEINIASPSRLCCGVWVVGLWEGGGCIQKVFRGVNT